MAKKATLIIDDKRFDLPVVMGTENEVGLDISRLRSDSGCITLDPGFVNTGSCISQITYIDGDEGILRYRGIPIEVLAEKASFLEVAYLLLFGKLPNKTELFSFDDHIRHHSMLDEDLKNVFRGFHRSGHPMAILGAMLFALSAKYNDQEGDPVEVIEHDTIRLMAKVPTILAFTYKQAEGQPFVYPNNELEYCANFMHMMFSLPVAQYETSDELLAALNLLLVLHADHEQNCSTSAVRMARSSLANLFTCVAAGIGALWGARHGGANQEVVEMLERIRSSGGNVKSYIDRVKDKTTNIMLMGFGHRVYKNFDPRARIIKIACDRLLKKLNISDPLLDIAKALEETALKDSYFIERKLYPNVDFYSGIMYRAMGIPAPFFPAMFAFGRLPGWLAQAREFSLDPGNKIYRPRQIYTGPVESEYIPMENR